MVSEKLFILLSIHEKKQQQQNPDTFSRMELRISIIISSSLSSEKLLPKTSEFVESYDYTIDKNIVSLGIEASPEKENGWSK